MMAIETQQKLLSEQGYVIVPRFFLPEKIDALFTDIYTVFEKQFARYGIAHSSADPLAKFEQNVSLLFSQSFDAFIGCNKQCQQLFSLYQLFINDTNKMLIQKLGLAFPTVCVKPILYMNSPSIAQQKFHYKTPPHQDWRSMQGSQNSIVQWLPLVDMHADIGPLKILPGSHANGLMKSETHPWYRSIPDSELANHQFVDVKINRGDLLVFSSFLVHQSGDITSDRFRWSCHFRLNDVDEQTFINRNFPHPYKVFIPYDITQENGS